MTYKVFQQGAIIQPNELSINDFMHLAKRGLQLQVGNKIYYFDPKSKHVYPQWTTIQKGYRVRYEWKKSTTYMSRYEFDRIPLSGGIVRVPAKQPKLSKSKPYESR